jgi:uncharacterized membrane protein
MPGGEADHAGAGAAATAPDPFGRADPPLLALTLWPHRSLTRGGGTAVLAIVAAGLSLPLLPLAGTGAAWSLLPFLIAALGGLYWAIRRNQQDGRLTEELRLWPDLITVVRREPRGAVRRWHANPFWVQPRLHPDGRVESYLTLRGNGREIELGAFLSPGERVALHRDLCAALAGLRPPAPAAAL